MNLRVGSYWHIYPSQVGGMAALVVCQVSRVVAAAGHDAGDSACCQPPLQFCSVAVDSSLCRWENVVRASSGPHGSQSLSLLDSASVSRGYPVSLTCLALPLLRVPCTPSVSRVVGSEVGSPRTSTSCL